MTLQSLCMTFGRLFFACPSMACSRFCQPFFVSQSKKMFLRRHCVARVRPKSGWILIRLLLCIFLLDSVCKYLPTFACAERSQCFSLYASRPTRIVSHRFFLIRVRLHTMLLFIIAFYAVLCWGIWRGIHAFSLMVNFYQHFAILLAGSAKLLVLLCRYRGKTKPLTLYIVCPIILRFGWLRYDFFAFSKIKLKVISFGRVAYTRSRLYRQVCKEIFFVGICR